MPYLIDGNNLIGTSADLSLSDSTSREKLIKRLLVVQKRTRKRFILVFDGDPQNYPQEFEPVPGKFQVKFPRFGMSADELIEELIERSSNPSGYILVSSDRRLREFARRHRVKSIRSEEFMRMVKKILREERKEKEWKKPDVKLSPQEVEIWMNIFKKGKRKK